jgi:hypothetical protein
MAYPFRPRHVSEQTTDTRKAYHSSATFMPPPIGGVTFAQRVRLVRAYSDNSDDECGQKLVFGFNALRNEVAHGRKTDKRTEKINELRQLIKGVARVEFGRQIETAAGAAANLSSEPASLRTASSAPRLGDRHSGYLLAHRSDRGRG